MSHRDIENYRQTVNKALDNIVIPFAALLCRDVSLPQNIKTSVKFDKAEMDIVRSDIESSVLDNGFINDCIVTFK